MCAYNDSEDACRCCGEFLEHGQYYTPVCTNCGIGCQNTEDGTPEGVLKYREIHKKTLSAAQKTALDERVRLRVPILFWDGDKGAEARAKEEEIKASLKTSLDEMFKTKVA